MIDYEKLCEELISVYPMNDYSFKNAMRGNIRGFKEMCGEAADAIGKLQSENSLLKIRLDAALSELNGARNCESFYTRKIEELQAEIERLKKQLEVATLLIVDTMRGVAMLNQEPEVDAVPVVHGRWEYLGDNSTGQIMGCTYCQKSINPDKTAVSLNRQTNYPDYCPNCGAEMDGKEQSHEQTDR